jgi:DNA-binding XRE family transcriptional regulator
LVKNVNQDISRRNFARILFDLRTEVRLSQKEMAKALGISTTSYQAWEGTSADRVSTVDPLQLTIENFRAVATLKKTSVDLLLQEIEEKEADGQQPNPFDRSRVIALLQVCQVG